MKRSIGAFKYKAAALSFAVFNAVVAMAQEEGGGAVTVSKTTKTTSHTVTNDWYTEPWAIIVGVAAFLLILIAIISANRGRSTSGTTNVSKTTVTRKDYTGTDA